MGAPDSVQSISVRLVAAFGRAAGVDPASLHRPGITIAAEADRAGSRLVSAYRIGPHLLVRCDPRVADECRGRFGSGDEPTLERFESAMADAHEVHGRGLVHVLVGPPLADPLRSVRVLETDQPRDRSLIAHLAAEDPDGAEWAEIELGRLDPHAVGVFDGDALVALASERPWPLDSSFGDIGVLTRPEFRRRGLAAGAVAALCRRMVSQGRTPLYRCDETNVASHAVATRVGFVEVATLSAVSL